MREGSISGRETIDFEAEFSGLTGGHSPFRWQRRLFARLCDPNRDLPAVLDLPTGLGKTSVMAIWYLARQAGASLPRRFSTLDAG